MGALTDLPSELVIGWALWVIGGLLLTLWFMRRSASTPSRDLAPEPVPAVRMSSSSSIAAVRQASGGHAAAARLSGTHAAAGRGLSGSRPAASQTPPAASVPDAFAELRALLDPPEEPPKSN